MRPPKLIAIFCDDQTELGTIATVLWSCGYRIVRGASLQELAAALTEKPAAFLVVHTRYAASAIRAGEWICSHHPDRPVIAVLSGKAEPHYPATYQIQKSCGMGILKEALRIACARKRGPRPAHHPEEAKTA